MRGFDCAARENSIDGDPAVVALYIGFRLFYKDLRSVKNSIPYVSLGKTRAMALRKH
jgi:hypothetical protein